MEVLAMSLRSITPSSSPHSHAVLLCIDDDEALLGCVTSMLERYGYHAVPALGGATGIQIFKDNAIDLVVVDHDMPGMDGCEVAEQLRRLNSSVPIIMNSGNPQMSRRAALAVDAYVPKGMDFEPLLS